MNVLAATDSAALQRNVAVSSSRGSATETTTVEIVRTKTENAVASIVRSYHAL